MFFPPAMKSPAQHQAPPRRLTTSDSRHRLASLLGRYKSTSGTWRRPGDVKGGKLEIPLKWRKKIIFLKKKKNKSGHFGTQIMARQEWRCITYKEMGLWLWNPRWPLDFRVGAGQAIVYRNDLSRFLKIPRIQWDDLFGSLKLCHKNVLSRFLMPNWCNVVPAGGFHGSSLVRREVSIPKSCWATCRTPLLGVDRPPAQQVLQ